MTRNIDRNESKPRVRRPWTKDKRQTGVRLTADEQKMLSALVKMLGVSQNAVLVLALREFHAARFPDAQKKAA